MARMVEEEFERSLSLDAVQRLLGDIKQASRTIDREQARYLVSMYYSIQKHRINADARILAFSKSKKSHMTLDFFSQQFDTLENDVKVALDAYSSSIPAGRWMREQKGIGPVLAAALLAHIDIEKAPTVGHILNFAGWNPNIKWEKGKKRPWNASLKVVCWKIGQQFIKVCNRDGAYYGHIYKQRSEQEKLKNEQGMFADQAALQLATKDYSKDTVAKSWYQQGKLPPAHIQSRAAHYAVRRFLSDMQTVMYWYHYHQAPPKPYIIDIGGHAHYELTPVFENVPGLVAALRARGAMDVGYKSQPDPTPTPARLELPQSVLRTSVTTASTEKLPAAPPVFAAKNTKKATDAKTKKATKRRQLLQLSLEGADFQASAPALSPGIESVLEARSRRAREAQEALLRSKA